MAEKRVQELLGQMQKTLECSICLEMMTNPVSTGCGHQFCRFCLMKLFDRERKGHQVLCPLCKKQVTKRSLMKREQLGEMVDGVRNLISAFQKDTGALFSPPRGPQASLLPGTPDVIQAKTSQSRKQSKETRRRNVRRSARVQPAESSTETLPSAFESPERIQTEKNTSDSKSSRRSSRNKNKHISATEGTDEAHQLELLKCIQEGPHHANSAEKHNTVNANDNSAGAVESRLETTLTDQTIHDKHEAIVSSTNDLHVCSVKFTEKNHKESNKMEEATTSAMSESGDIEIPVLSGNSLAVESETSSGPLFKTPLDPKNRGHSEKGLAESEQSQNEGSKRLLRTRNKILNYGDSVVVDNEESSVKLTPETLVVKESAISRTYSRKDKDSFTKEKKANKKVTEWLKNIPAAAECESDVSNKVKGGKKQIKSSKKNLKVIEEEEAMGSKIKHLAKQVQDNGKSLLFDIDDFGVEESMNSEVELEIIDENNVVSEKGVEFNDKEKVKDEADITSKIKHERVDMNNETDLSVQSTASEPSAGSDERVKNSVRRKRIFKSKTPTVSMETVANHTTVPTAGERLNNIIKPDKNTSEVIPLDSSAKESFDPYEFKSSQNTPKKITKKKNKQKQSGKLTVKTKKNKKVTEKELEVNRVKEANDNMDKNFEKMWDRNLVPDKTILKVKSVEDISKINASLNQAESYDLLTCTQEAVESIAKENENLKAKSVDETGVIKETHAQKKVRFTEPLISDFIGVGKIDIVGYRKARDQFNAAHLDTKGKSYMEEKEPPKRCMEEKEPPVGKRSERLKAVSNESENPVCDSEIPVCKEGNTNKDDESDDLSEDYRFRDDSSGTDDLDIEPTPEQFEKPNFEIQSDEIKSQLSLVVQDTVLETPQIPLNKDSSSEHIVEETPAVLCGPKFNKALSKPFGKTQKLSRIPGSIDETRGRAVTNKSKNIIEQGHKITVALPAVDQNIDSDMKENKEMTDDESKSNKCNENPEKCNETVGVEKCRVNIEKVSPKLPTDSEETRSPDGVVDFVQDTCKSEAKVKNIPRWIDKEIQQAKTTDSISSLSTETQNSESILVPKGSVLNSNIYKTDKSEKELEEVGDAEINEKNQVDFKNISELKQCEAEQGVKIEIKMQSKKKRKSFMLDDTEESLDFGSLSESACAKVHVNDDSETVSKAKRQRVNRLKRSPKNKENILLHKIKGSPQISVKNGNANAESGDVEGESSNSLEIIPDTVVSDCIELNSGNQKLSCETECIESKPKWHNSKKRRKFSKETENDTLEKNVNHGTDSQDVVILNSPSDSVTKGRMQSRDDGNDKLGAEVKDLVKHRQDFHAKENSLEIVDVIGETEMSNTENVENNELKNKLINLDDVEVHKNAANKHTFYSEKSQQESKKLLQQSEMDENSAIDGDIVKVRHLSGVLLSPQESLAFTNTKDSPEDIFQIGSEMPSVDLTPDEETVGPSHCSPSLDLGTLASLESVDQLALASLENNATLDSEKKETEENIKFEKLQSRPGTSTPKGKRILEPDVESRPDDLKKKPKVKAVRGFSKRRSNRQSSLSNSDSGNSVIPKTPQSQSIVKSNALVPEFISPNLVGSVSDAINIDKADMETDSKLSNGKHEFSKKQSLLYSPLRKEEKPLTKYSPIVGNKKIGHLSDKIHPEIVEMKSNANEYRDQEILLSPNDLPDLDNGNAIETLGNDNIDSFEGSDVESSQDENDELQTKSKISPKLLLKSPDKAMNIVVQPQDENNDIEESNLITTVPETMSASVVEEMDEDANTPEVIAVQNSQTNSAIVNDDENSMHSSTSSDFRLDSSDDEESPEIQAFNVISKFDKIVEDSIEIESNKNKLCKQRYLKEETTGKGGEYEITNNNSKTKKINQKKGKTSVRSKTSIKDEDMYSCRLDSSPSSQSADDMVGDSEPVILESDIDEDDDNVIDKEKLGGNSDHMMSNCNISSKANQVEGQNDNDGDEDSNSDYDDDDDSYKAVVRRKGVKRAIISDSSSNDEDEDSRHMSISSASALSSQSENLTTQERFTLEKEVERMAKEMAALKEQLRRSKELKLSKASERKTFPKPVTVDDSEEDMIELADSDDGEDDLFMSQPAVCLDDLPDEEEETMITDGVQETVSPDDVEQETMSPDGVEQETVSPDDVQQETMNPDDVQQETVNPDDVQEETVNPDDVQEETVNPDDVQDTENEIAELEKSPEVEESLTMPPSSLTVPESDPSQVPRQALADVDTNIAQPATPQVTPGKMRHIGIVVTGLSQQQIMHTKKLAALNDVKFFTKFNDQVTHVVVKPAEEDETVCDRTLKFFQGISRRCWIVNYFWVVDCRQVGHLLPEGPYEIQGDTANNEVHHGPRRARLSKDMLFKKFQFSLIGDNTYLSKETMTDLIETCGGRVLDIAHLGQGTRKPLVISCTDIDEDEEDKRFITKHARELSPGNQNTTQDLYKGLGVVTLTREWILDTLTMYRIQPLKDYVITDSPNLKLP